MKKLYIRSLMLLLALTWIIPKMDAQTYSFSIKDPSDWSKTFSTPGSLFVDAAVTDDAFFTAPAYGGSFLATYYTQGYRIDNTYGAQSFSFGGSSSGQYLCAGPGIAQDSKGTVLFKWVSSGSNAGLYGALTSVKYFTRNPNPGAGTTAAGVVIDTPTATTRSDRMTAYGDCIGGTGYIWVVPYYTNGTTKYTCAERLKFTSGSPATAFEKFRIPDEFTNTGGTNSRVVQYSDTEILYDHGNATLYKGVISGTSVTWTSLGVKNTATGATMFEFCGKEFLVYAKSDTQFTVRNVTDGVDVVSITPFGTASAIGSTRFNFNAVIADATTAYIYVYVPGVGAARYSLVANVAAAPIQNLKAVLTLEDDMPTPNVNKAGRQNMLLSWEANASWTTQPTSYQVQYKRVLIDPSTGAESIYQPYLTTSSYYRADGFYNLGTTTTTSYTHWDVKYLKSSHVNYETKYIYRVIPIFNGATGSVSEEVANDKNPEFIPITPDWIWLFGEETYDGLCMTQLYWDYPGYGLKPDSYEILRDGELITKDERVAAFVHVDYEAKAGHTHKYEIRTYYNGLDNSNYAISAPRTATIGSRDWSKPKYSITEIYNFSLEDGEYEIAADAQATNFLVRDCYPQATFKNGKWYVSQMYDGLVDRGLYDPTNSRYVSGNTWAGYISAVEAAGSYGGILVFDGDAQAQSNGKMKGGYRISNIQPRVYQNRGIGVDDAGNIFIRGIAKTSAAKADYAYCHDFEYMMTSGEVYKANGDGTYSSTKYTVDFSAVNFAEMSQDTGGPVEGRCDYFSMKGDVFSSEGAYLYVAPTQTKATYVFKLTAGSGTTITAEKVGTYFEHGTNQKTGASYNASIENYAFPVNCVGREDQFIHNVRSNIFRNLKIDNSGTIQYDEQLWTISPTNGSTTYLSNKPYSWNVSGVEGYAPAQPTKNVEGRIYDFHSRVNNPGGSTFEFNGELFIVTPISQYSINTGSFYVGRGYRGLDSATGLRKGPKDADLANVVPVATVYQSDEATSAGSNSAGVWVYGEVPTLAEEMANGIAEVDADADGDGKVDYAYIYVFAPAKRFAKYKLMPDALFPPSPNELTVKPVYEPTENNPTSDLVRYDAEVTWAPMEYGYNVPDENGVKTGNYSVYYYTVTLYDNSDPANPVVVGTEKVYVYNSEDGTSADKVVLGDDGKVVNYTTTFPDVPVYDADGNKIPYVSEVVVTYLGEKGTVAETAGEKNSIETESEDDNSFDTAPPAGVVNIGKTEEWADWNQPYGEKDDNDGYWDVYRIELEPTNPQWEDGQVEEPVSCYTINVSGPATETNDATDKEICSFYLYDPDNNPSLDGVQNVTGLEPDAQGYVHVTTCTIPGNYVFNPDDEHPDIYWDERDYTGQTTGENAPADDGQINPEEWTFYVSAVYADSNPQLRTIEEGSMEKGGVPTEVEVIKNETSFRVYPNPATTAINVKSMSGITEVKIYTLAGVEVKAVAANGENHVVILVDDLVEGYYLLKVNNHAPVKVLVK